MSLLMYSSKFDEENFQKNKPNPLIFDRNATYFKRNRQATGKHLLKIQSSILIPNTSDLVLLVLA